MDYQSKLLATKQNYPFEEWLTYGQGDDPMEQYTLANCGAAAAIFDELIGSLIELGEGADDEEKIARFESAVEALNDLNDETELIETGEREELCELIDRIGNAADIEINKAEETLTGTRDW